MQLSTRMPSLAFGVLDHAGTEVVDAALLLDGRALPVAPGLAVEMDPGVHEVEARGPRDTRATARFVAHEGERSRKIELRLSAPVLATPAPAPRSHPLPLAPMAVGGAGLILTGLGVGFVVAGATSYGNLKDTCAPSCTDDVVDSARTRSIAGDVLLGTGLVTLAAAGVWLFFATRSSATPPVTTAVRF